MFLYLYLVLRVFIYKEPEIINNNKLTANKKILLLKYAFFMKNGTVYFRSMDNKKGTPFMKGVPLKCLNEKTKIQLLGRSLRRGQPENIVFL
jgi:hypothetical protein